MNSFDWAADFQSGAFLSLGFYNIKQSQPAEWSPNNLISNSEAGAKLRLSSSLLHSLKFGPNDEHESLYIK
jgi:hypothetical protein